MHHIKGSANLIDYSKRSSWLTSQVLSNISIANLKTSSKNPGEELVQRPV